MKKLWILVLFMLCLSTTAAAMEYDVEAPDAGLFGQPTSDETVYVETQPANQDVSKNSALIPPSFGTPTSYLPGSGEPLTPNLATTDGGTSSAGSSSSGAAGGWTVMGSTTAPNAVTPPQTSTTPPPSDITVTYPNPDTSTGYPSYNTAYTSVTSDLYYSGGQLGTLSIPAIGLSVKVYEGTGSTPLSRGAGHFEDTSIWNGNVALAGHNRGVTNHFGRIHTLDTGDHITFTTKLGTRTYEVVSVAQVSETDRSGLASTNDNYLTLYTCVMNQRDLRWCVQARQI